MAALERVLHRFTHACEASWVAFVRLIESAAPDGPRETVVPSFLPVEFLLSREKKLPQADLRPHRASGPVLGGVPFPEG